MAKDVLVEPGIPSARLNLSLSKRQVFLLVQLYYFANDGPPGVLVLPLPFLLCPSLAVYNPLRGLI